jgi:hypothetical protein
MPKIPVSTYWGLSAVTAISSSDLWAVGSCTTDNHHFPRSYKTLMENWDVKQWSVVKSPNGPLASNGALGRGGAFAV